MTATCTCCQPARGLRWVPSFWMRWPTCQKRHSFLMSTWSNFPGRPRLLRTTGAVGPLQARVPNRRTTLPKVEAGRSSKAPNVTGSAPLRWRAARTSASAAELSRRDCGSGVDGPSRSPAHRSAW